MTVTEQQLDEETPLLPGKKKATPLPLFQFTIVLVLQLAEPLTSQVIYPFAPQLIREIGITGGDESKVGYYVGMMQSLFFLTQAFTVLHWSRLSDRIGRKPVILTGLAGLSCCMYCFGLSTTFWGLVLSRSMSGALNGNIGVIKSMMAEMTDSTNISQAYAYMPIAWSSGSTLGPMIGGFLARPADRFPNIFGNSEFMKKYPYFLPCSVPATFTVFAWTVTYLYLKETLEHPQPIGRYFNFFQSKKVKVVAEQEVEESLRVDPARTKSRHEDDDLPAKDHPLPLRSLLTYEVVIAAANYASLSLVDISLRAVHPLFLSTPIELGGVGLPPPVIGKILSVFGVMNGLAQVLFFAKVHNRWGSKRVFVAGLCSALPALAFFPVINMLARQQGYSLAVQAAVMGQILVFLPMSLSYGAIFIFITSASPNKASLGATNGLCQMLVSVMRTIGPAMANSLFSFSMKTGYLEGYLVYYILLCVASISLYVGCLLPRHIEPRF